MDLLYRNGDMGPFISFILGFFLVFLVIILIIGILTIIGQWKLFTKAGRKGWEAIIPVYNTYVLCQISGVNPWWIVIVLASGFITALVPALTILGSIVNIYFGVLLAVSVSRSFGKSDAYAIGIYFFAWIFYLILGFGSSKYLGPKPMQDIIFKDNPSNNNTSTPEATVHEDDTSDDVHYCPSCGTKLAIDTKYCPHCGREL